MNTAKVINLPVSPKREEEMLTAQEAASLFRIGRDMLYRLAHTVDTTGFPAIWCGERKVLFPREALREWLNSEAGRKALYKIMKSGK